MELENLQKQLNQTKKRKTSQRYFIYASELCQFFMTYQSKAYHVLGKIWGSTLKNLLALYLLQTKLLRVRAQLFKLNTTN